jgi:hypothetical protein
MSSNRIARRKFLGAAAKSFAALGVGTSLFDFAVNELFGKALSMSLPSAMAAGAMDAEPIYVHVSLNGGPPRWYFDLPLNPTGDSASFLAGGFGNWINVSSGKATSTHVARELVVGGKKIYLPPIWTMNVGGHKLSDLLGNTAFIRGVDAEINSHGLSRARQVSPIINGLSLSGLTADASTKPMAGIIAGEAGNAFKSAKALAAVRFPGGANPLQTILSPFRPFSAAAKFQSAEWKSLKAQALSRFDDYASQNGYARTALKNAYDNANSMIDDKVYGLSDGWNDIVNRYKAVVASALSVDEMKILFPQAIKADGTAQFRIVTDVHSSDADLRDSLAGATAAGPMFNGLAEQFAVAEALILNDITSTVSIDTAGLSNLKVNGSAYAMPSDQHNVGRITSTLFTTAFYRAIAGCIAELSSALRRTGRFDRSPRADGSGSDHGVTGSNSTIFSGAIKGCAVIGNVKRDSGIGGYPGTWGVSEKFDLGGFNRPIQVNDVALTIAGLLGVLPQGLVTSGRSLINPVTGLPVKAEAKNV